MKQGLPPPLFPAFVVLATKSPVTSNPKNSSPASGAVLYAAWFAARANDARPDPDPPLPIDHANVGCVFDNIAVNADSSRAGEYDNLNTASNMPRPMRYGCE